MKRWKTSHRFLVGSALALLFGCFSAGAANAAENNIKILLDEKPLIADVPPMLLKDRTYLPLRAIFEALGAEVEWFPETSEVRGTKGSTVIVLHVDDTQALVNGRPVALDAAPVIVQDRTMVPVRFLAESLGADVQWNAVTSTVSINQRQYQLNTLVNGQGRVEINGKQNTFLAGSTVLIAAVPDPGWEFDRWIGAVADPQSVTTTVRIQSDTYIQALFRKKVTAPPPSPTNPTSPTTPLPGIEVSSFLTYVNSYSGIGIPYEWGGTDLTPFGKGIDCSSFVQQMYASVGVTLPRTSEDQFTVGTPVARTDLQPGDLIFFHTNGEGATHVGIYTGAGLFVSATVSGGVKAQSLEIAYWDENYEGARRVAIPTAPPLLGKK